MASTASPKMLQAYDNTLLGILQNEAGLEPFLDVVFGFLSRRTDFYQIMTEPKQRYGFPVGVAEKLVEKYFRKYQSVVVEAQSKAMEKKKQTEEEKKPKSCEVTPTQDDGEPVKSSKSQDAPNSSKEINKDEQIAQISADVKNENKPSNNVETENKAPTTNEDGSLNQAAFQNNPDSYNGAMLDKYSWSQNYDDVDVKIPVNKSVIKGKQVKVDIKRKHLSVQVLVNQGDESMTTIINSDLQHEVNKEESMWSLECGKSIIITLTKDKSIWWTKLLEGDEEIDIQKICPERSMADMDEEEKAVIDKLKFDENQKRMGLPQSHEMKVHEMLKKGWNVDGSPFKGQQFDPKMFNISPGSVGQ
uniref:NudC domain-containing protein 3-like n=1 Tax=Phallusia mammillata TaxID=59560 RepID=A0A6F9DM05_9ASCI|nr:nudC domain-containing protein 3-like [Phallusia mammillata]